MWGSYTASQVLCPQSAVESPSHAPPNFNKAAAAAEKHIASRIPNPPRGSRAHHLGRMRSVLRVRQRSRDEAPLRPTRSKSARRPRLAVCWICLVTQLAAPCLLVGPPRELLSAVDHRDHIDLVWLDVVHDAVGPLNNLADLAEPDLWDDATRPGERRDLL